MNEMIRLDKYLADMGLGSRSQIKTDIRKGKVRINDQVAKKPETKIHTKEDKVFYNDQEISYAHYEYYMLNKPKGVVSATSDPKCETVIDLIDTKLRKDLFPVGRLDKDTEGLLIITNDGDLTHRLLSPRKHVSKVYYAKVEGIVTQEDVLSFKQGLVVDDEFTALPADLLILHTGEESEIELTIVEGKFHQVKRMFEAVGKEVIYLRRIAMGSLLLDESLSPGEFRTLSMEELDLLLTESGRTIK